MAMAKPAISSNARITTHNGRGIMPDVPTKAQMTILKMTIALNHFDFS